MLKSLGVKKGDTVSIYLPMTWQAVAAFLACARIGAVHSVVFAGFSAESLRDRMNDCKSRVLITSDEGRRGGKTIATKVIADAAIKQSPGVQHVLVLKRTGNEVPWTEGRDKWWHEETAKVPNYCPPEIMSAEDPLFILYVSPRSSLLLFCINNLNPQLPDRPLARPESRRASCTPQEGTSSVLPSPSSTSSTSTRTTSSPAWPTSAGSPATREFFFSLFPFPLAPRSHSHAATSRRYIVYGPLANGVSTTVFESTPVYPTPSRYWQTVEKHKLTQFYSAPTAIRLLRRLGHHHVEGHDLSSLRVLGSVGEPINPEAWHWYNDHVGQRQCAIVDTFWQTETGSIVVTPFPGAIETKPGSATVPFFGIEPAILDPVTGKVRLLGWWSPARES